MASGALLLPDIRKRLSVTKRGGRRNTAALPFPPTVGLSLFAPVIASLFAVGMLVTPLPVVSLVSGSLLVVRAIGPVSFHHIRPVRPIFMIVPVMIVAMARIIDPYLYACLGLRCGHDCRRENSSS
jgi:hypothetical protein